MADPLKAFRVAMAAPAALPEFAGTVTAIETAPFWSEELGAIDKKKDQVRQMAYLLKSKNKSWKKFFQVLAHCFMACDS